VGVVVMVATRVAGLVDVTRGENLVDDFRVVQAAARSWFTCRYCALSTSTQS
jgi:hypothetical protein